MKKIIIKLSFTIFAIGISNFLSAQSTKEILNWYNGDGTGMQTNKAYKKLKSKKSNNVVVAVIDSGIDIEHEDLKGKIWVNKNEIPKNGIDDDKNGYVDDVNGWSFLGNAKGENLNEACLEKTRILKKLSKQFEGIDPANLGASEKEQYNLFLKVQEEVNKEKEEYEGYLNQLPMIEMMVKQVPSMVAKELKKEKYTLKDLEKWQPTSMELIQLKEFAIAIETDQFNEKDMADQKKQLEQMVNFNLNVDFDDRAIIGDNSADFSDKNYGNNDVEGPDAMHGTHVGGIIGAVRGNKLGGEGVAENVSLMVLRAVPNGDEHDKDVALAVRYAVDNGAQIINMSFGKSYSMYQKEVSDAFAYADAKGVLLVHAAGNYNANMEIDPNFPMAQYSFQKEPLKHFITIGASTRYPKEQLAASFSNYGASKVDVFAPGFEIYNTVPQSSYAKLQGTSMAAPMVAGVAALLKSYFPSLTMLEIKEVMLKSAKSHKGTQQIVPGTDQKADFATLSVTGGVVNVLNAVKMCMELEKTKSAN